MMIGIQTTGNNFDGIGATIQLGGDGTLKLANIKGLTLNGCFKLSLAYDVAPVPGGQGSIISGKLSKRIGLLSLFSTYNLPKGDTVTGAYFDLEAISPNLRGNYFILFDTLGNAQYNEGYGDIPGWGGMIMGNMSGLVTVLPQAFKAMGGPDISCLMPVLQKLMNMIGPIFEKHPLILMMPMSSMVQLMPLMGMGE